MILDNRIWMTLLFLLLSQKGNSQQDNERQILTSFYNTCFGSSWARNENWLDASISVCSWFGIRCNDVGSVVEIKLRTNLLRCELPEIIFYLPSLQFLDVSGNNNVFINFRQTDPFLAADMRGIFFAGTMVHSLDGIDTFPNLEAVGAGECALTGEFPPQLKQLTKLTTLDLSNNFLSGSFPDDIDILSNLQIFLANNNMLIGTLGPAIGNLKDLNQFSIQFNNMTGTLPVELTQLTSLTFLSLNDQIIEDGKGFTGPMLDFANAPFLVSVDVSNNALSGTVPPSLLKSVDPTFSRLMNVDMSGNRLSGVVPAELSRFESLRLYLSGNNIVGIDSRLCSKDTWFFGDVGQFGCDGILCPPGSFNVFGRQISIDYPCEICSSSSYFGATKCVPEASTISVQAANMRSGFIDSDTAEDQVVGYDVNDSPVDPLVNESLTIIFQSLSLHGCGSNSSANSSASNQQNDGVDMLNSTLTLRSVARANDGITSGAIDPFQSGLSVLFFGLLFALTR
jgi:Leucine-rich repeat (LRR) protein